MRAAARAPLPGAAPMPAQERRPAQEVKLEREVLQGTAEPRGVEAKMEPALRLAMQGRQEQAQRRARVGLEAVEVPAAAEAQVGLVAPVAAGGRHGDRSPMIAYGTPRSLLTPLSTPVRLEWLPSWSTTGDGA